MAFPLPRRITAAVDRLQRFRRSRAFLPAAIVVPVLALSGVGGGYIAWDSTRVAVPDVIGQPVTDAIGALEAVGLGVEEFEIPDPSLDADCYAVAHQSIPAGNRVVPEETAVGLGIEPTAGAVPNVVGMTLGEASRELGASCLHAHTARIWCVPDDFSGGTEMLKTAALAEDTGFTFDSRFAQLRHTSLAADDSWVVCDQMNSPQSRLVAESSVGLVLTAPLTTVPAPHEPVLASTLDALKRTADECALVPDIVPTFPDDPDAIRTAQKPTIETMTNWAVVSLTPAPGRALLCEARVRVEVVWPSTTMPQLVGRFHAPEASGAATAVTTALQSSGLTPTCSGRGTVTSQSPAAGVPVPIGTAVTCVAELVMPDIVGMDHATAASTLEAAGVSGSSSGSGIVVRQSPAAGTHLTGSQYVSYTAEEPRRAPISGGGGYAYYENCTAARNAGAAPVYRGEPGYGRHLDRDNDGIGCE